MSRTLGEAHLTGVAAPVLPGTYNRIPSCANSES